MNSRPYQMKARAASAEATRQRVIDGAMALLRTKFRSEIRLEEVAAVAGVTTQTVINLFGSKNHLLALALVSVIQRASSLRRAPQPGDMAGAVSSLYEHYEDIGDWVVRNVFEEADPELLKIGRGKHREWIGVYFGPRLDCFEDAERERRFEGVLAACDVLTWKLLRRDIGHSQADAEAIVLTMVESLLRPE